jgi:hypothetical protein
MMGKAMVVVTLLVVSGIGTMLFLRYSDRSSSAALQWAIFYAVGVGMPSWWSYRTARALRSLKVPLTNELRMVPFYPVLAGVLTMIVAIGLLREAMLTR